MPEVERDEAEAKATSLFRNQLLTPQQASTSGAAASGKAPASSMPSSVNVVQKEPRVGRHTPSLRGGLDEERLCERECVHIFSVCVFVRLWAPQPVCYYEELWIGQHMPALVRGGVDGDWMCDGCLSGMLCRPRWRCSSLVMMKTMMCHESVVFLVQASMEMQ